MATTKKSQRFATKSAGMPRDHKPSKDEVFEIETSAGVVKIRPLKVNYRLMRMTVEMGEAQAAITLIEKNLLDESREVMDDLSEVEIAEFMEVWQEASQIDLGESEASSD